MPLRSRLLVAVVAAGALVLGSASAHAAGRGPGGPTVAGAPLARDGASAPALPTWARAYAQGQWSVAIELLETIPESSRTAWHWLHLARALEKHAQLVESFGAYERLLDVVAEGADLPGMKDLERQARLESSLLSGRIPWADVALGEGLPVGALVFVDQQWLEPARLRSPYPVNPGWHTFLVESNGEVLAARRTFFAEGQSRMIPLAPLSEHALALEDGAGSAATAGAVSGPRTYGTPVSHQSQRRRPLSWRPDSPGVGVDRGGSLLTASYVSLGVGALGAVLGTGFIADYRSGDGGNELGLATASYAIGFSALVTGGVLWLLHRDAARASLGIAGVELEPRVYPSGAAVSARF